MNYTNTNKLIEQYKVLDNLTSVENARLDQCKVSLEIALRQKYGSRLHDIIVEHIVGNISRDANVFHFVVSGETDLIDPSDRSSFLPIAESQVNGNELACRNLAFNDAALRTKLESDFIESIRPETRMSFDRDGTLQKRMNDFVDTKLDLQT